MILFLQECEQCDTHCESCTGSGPKQCITCIPPYHLQTDLHRCVLCCTDAHRHGCCNCHPTTGMLGEIYDRTVKSLATVANTQCVVLVL